jgi:hypothetical protein
MEEAQRRINAWIQSGDPTDTLDLSDLGLTELPVLPSGLQVLWCNINNLTSLDNLPSRLQKLECRGNKLTSLDNLPDGLQDLNCAFNRLTSLDNLPDGLQVLKCNFNDLTSLDNLPSGLQELSCWSNNLTALDNLPSRLQKFNCDYVQHHICSSTCSCSQFRKFYIIEITREHYVGKYNNVLKDIMSEPLMAPMVTQYINIPVRKCYELYGI